MRCEKCKGKTTVLETRKNEKFSGVYRRRKCLNCGHKFITVEEITTDIDIMKCIQMLNQLKGV